MYMSSSLISAKLSPTAYNFFFKKCICLNRITKCLTYVIENRSESFIFFLFYFIPHSALIGVFSIVLLFFFYSVSFCAVLFLKLTKPFTVFVFSYFFFLSFFISLSAKLSKHNFFSLSPFWVEWNSIVLSK